MLKKLLLLTTLAAPAAFASHLSYYPSPATGQSVSGNLVELSVQDRQTGQSLLVYAKDGAFHIAGEPGHTYSLTAENRTDEELMVVLSIDGVNVITGETASAKQDGYLLYPHSRAVVSGWRKSMNEVAQFYFTPVADSYAARTDRPANTGVIGAAVFRSAMREMPHSHPQPHRMQQESRFDGQTADTSGINAAPAASTASTVQGFTPRNLSATNAGRRAEKLGTGHGQLEAAEVDYADFTPDVAPAEIIAVNYDSRARLVRQGIIPRDNARPARPNPFPNDQFAPDPRR